MQQIEIDFEVFKALTNLRQHEYHTYNDVIRNLLGFPEAPSLIPGMKGALLGARQASSGFIASGRFLPDGTLLQARYKGVPYEASIHDGKWIGKNGEEFTSASSAARAITQTNVNGLVFWEVKRPSDLNWRKLDALPKAST